MKNAIEAHMPYFWLALVVLALFYGIYFAKMLAQKRRGIRTHQIGRRKEHSIHTVEMLMNLEDKIGVEVELTQKVETVGELVAFIEGVMEQK